MGSKSFSNHPQVTNQSTSNREINTQIWKKWIENLKKFSDDFMVNRDQPDQQNRENF